MPWLFLLAGVGSDRPLRRDAFSALNVADGSIRGLRAARELPFKRSDGAIEVGLRALPRIAATPAAADRRTAMSASDGVLPFGFGRRMSADANT
jgi:hypothetical protein